MTSYGALFADSCLYDSEWTQKHSLVRVRLVPDSTAVSHTKHISTHNHIFSIHETDIVMVMGFFVPIPKHNES